MLKNFAALIAGCTLVAALLWVAQVTLDKSPTGDSMSISVKQHSQLRQASGLVEQTDVQAKIKDSVVWDVRITLDQYRRRVVPYPNSASGQRFAMFFGGSNTFGHGLDDDETLPALVAALAPDFEVYNYAASGMGTGQVLALIEETDFRHQITQKRGYAVYVFPAFHVDRLVGGVAPMRWAGPLPYYVMTGDGIQRKGFIQDERPLYAWLARLLGNSFLYQRFGIDWPFTIDDDDWRLACRAIVKAMDGLRQQFESLNFLLVLHPIGADRMPQSWPGSCLSPNGVEFLDLSGAFVGMDWDSITIARDGHINRHGNAILARDIADYLLGHPGQ